LSMATGSEVFAESKPSVYLAQSWESAPSENCMMADLAVLCATVIVTRRLRCCAQQTGVHEMVVEALLVAICST
jgi:hypothetical protein